MELPPKDDFSAKSYKALATLDPEAKRAVRRQALRLIFQAVIDLVAYGESPVGLVLQAKTKDSFQGVASHANLPDTREVLDDPASGGEANNQKNKKGNGDDEIIPTA